MGFKLVAFDCDGVLVDTESSWQWIHDHFGVSNEDALEAYFRDEIDGLEFMRRDIALWRSVDPAISIDKVRAILMRIPLMKGIDGLARSLGEAGCRTVIISGGLDLLVDHIAERIGAWKGLANALEHDGDGLLTGEGILRVEPRHKQENLLEVMRELGVAREEAAAVGDTRGDASMFRACGLGIAFNPADDVIRNRADVVVEEKDLCLLKEHLVR